MVHDCSELASGTVKMRGKNWRFCSVIRIDQHLPGVYSYYLVVVFVFTLKLEFEKDKGCIFRNKQFTIAHDLLQLICSKKYCMIETSIIYQCHMVK